MGRRNQGENEPPKWESLSKEMQDKFLEDGSLVHWYINGMVSDQSFYSKSEIDDLIIKAKSKGTNYYGVTDTYVYEALEKYHIKDKEIAVFPFACSISSFEHDGLGRYGDPLNPDGDIEAMRNVKDNILEKGGILFLAVPCGVDKTVFNAHRVYGNRLNKLIEGFEVLDSFPKNLNQILQTDTGKDAAYQPLLVLKSI